MNQDTIGRFAQLFTLTDADAAERITIRLELALRHPDEYQEQYAEELAERDIMDTLPVQELRDLALIDALLSEDLAWETSAGESAASIAEGLNEILARQNQGLALTPGTLAGGRSQGPEALDALQDALEAAGLALVLFTLDSDSYPLSVVADAQAEEARQLAKELGFGVTVY
jgi:hypothetical protein